MAKVGWSAVSIILWLISFAVTALAQPAGKIASTTSTASFVYIPYDQASGPQFRQNQSVLLPYAEFLRLKGTTQGIIDEPGFKPQASLAQADYTGHVADNVARLNAELTLDVLARAKDTLTVRLPFGGCAVEKADVEGAQATLAPLEDAVGLSVTMKGEGRRVVRLQLAVPVASEGAVKRLDFRAPRAAAAVITLHVPDDVVIQTVPDALPAVAAPAKAGGADITASAGSNERLFFAWRPKLEARAAAADTRFSVTQEVRASISPQSAVLRADMHTEFLAGSMTTMSIAIPDGAQLLGVAGSFVKDWNTAADGKSVSVALVREVSQPFDISLELKLPDDDSTSQLTVPPIAVPGAARVTGKVTALPDDGLAIWPEETAGLEPVTGSAPGTIARTFRFTQPDWRLVLSRRPIQPRLRSDSIVLYEVTEEFLRIKSRHHIVISGRGVFSLTFEAPEGYELKDAGPPDLVSGSRREGRRIEVNLRGEQRNAIDVELRLQRSRTAEESAVQLQPVSLIDAEEDAGSIVLAAPAALRATETGSEGLQATDVRTLGERLKPLLSPDIAPVLGYRYFTPGFQVAASIEKQRTRLTCETAVLVSITPSLMKVDATLAYNVEFSAADEFQLLLPAAVGEDVRFNGSDIKEKVRAPTTNESQSTWTIRLQRRVLGAYNLGVSFDTPIPDAAAGKGVQVTAPVVRALNVARETGFVAVSRGENLEVRVAESEGLEPRDVKELPANLAASFLGFRYFEPEKQMLKLELVRHELEPVLGALIRRMHMDTVLTDQREATHEVIFEVQNNREQYLVLLMPDGMEIWGAFVRGVPVRPSTRASDKASLIELTKSESRDDAFRVRLIMHEKLPGGPLGTRGKLEFRSPEALNMPTLRVTRKLYLPPRYRYMDFAGTMRLESGGSRPWIEPAAEKLLTDFPAMIASGSASPEVNPPQSAQSPHYDPAETELEKKARLQGSAIEFQIVRDGVQFEFSKLSGVGDIRIHYWKKRPLLMIQGAVALGTFLILLLFAGMGRRPLIPLLGCAIAFIGASLSEGIAARFWNPAFAGAVAALGLSVLAYVVRKSRESRLQAAQIRRAFDEERATPQYAYVPPPVVSPTVTPPTVTPPTVAPPPDDSPPAAEHGPDSEPRDKA